MATQLKHPGLLIVLCGPSGVGKSTISRELAEKYSVSYIVSATTRPKRDGDDKGKKYEHISKEEFFRRLEADEFLEYAQVYDDYYGTPKHPALDLLAQGKDFCWKSTFRGLCRSVISTRNVLAIFILPPDEPTLLHRLQAAAGTAVTKSQSASGPPSAKFTWPKEAGRSITW